MILIKIFSIFLILCVSSTKCEIYSSTLDIQGLLNMERLLLENLEAFLEGEHKKLIKLEKILADVDVVPSGETYASTQSYNSPIGAFKILKRITKKRQLLLTVFDDTENQEVYLMNLMQIKGDDAVTENDLLGAAKGIALLQQTYNFLTEDIANGKLQGIQLSSEMTAADCFELGVQLINGSDYKNARSWLLEAQRRLYVDNDERSSTALYLSTVTDELILSYLIPLLAENGNYKLAYRLLILQLTYNPENPEALENASVIAENIEYSRLRLLDEPEIFNKKTTQKPTVQQLYEETCSGKLKQTPREQRPLRCRYVDNGVPFCRLARFKLEELNSDPFVAFYHEAIYENEIKNIITESAKYVKRSKVSGSNPIVSDVRTSKHTWLFFSQHRFLDRLAQRFEDITGLTLKSSKDLQVANYGIAGHYGPHYDFSESPNNTYSGMGNRVLTALFYISKVDMGGATAFPFLRLAVPPIHRSLLVWPNMHYSGELDYRTKHAGCPVIKGSKWICNEWFHIIGQEFHRPCKLQPDGHKSIEYKGYY